MLKTQDRQATRVSAVMQYCLQIVKAVPEVGSQ